MKLDFRPSEFQERQYKKRKKRLEKFWKDVKEGKYKNILSFEENGW